MLDGLPDGTAAGIISGLVVAIIVAVWKGVRDWLNEHPWVSGAAAGIIASLIFSGEGPGQNGDESSPAGSVMLPPGLVVASTRPCDDLEQSSDWSDFTDAAGRVLVGVGETEIEGWRREFLPTETGGYWAHELTIEEMPQHTHRISTDTNVEVHNGLGGSEESYGITREFIDQPDKRNWTTVLPDMLEETGGRLDGSTQPHNNMPPYIALYFCKKEAG